MTVRYSCTFEFPTRAALTFRGTVAASQVHTCVSRATKEAKQALKPQGWSSMVCVLLEQFKENGPAGGEAAGPHNPRRIRR